MDPTTMSGKVRLEDTSSFEGIQNRITSVRKGVNVSVCQRNEQNLQTKKKRTVGIRGRKRNAGTK